MFDSILAKINGWIAAGVDSWEHVIAQIQQAISDASDAIASHQSIREESIAFGYGDEWTAINERLTSKYDQLITLARGINAISSGEPITGLGFVFPPIIAGLTVGGALFLLGTIYIVISESYDFFLKVTGKAPPTGGRVDSLVKFGIVAAAVVLLLPKLWSVVKWPITKKT